MRAMLLEALGQPLILRELPDPQLGPGELRVRAPPAGCAVPTCTWSTANCRRCVSSPATRSSAGWTPLGRASRVSRSASGSASPGWGTPAASAGTAGTTRKTSATRRSSPVTLVPAATPNGGVANARFAFGLDEDGDDVALAPLLCAGLIGRRSLVKAGPVRRLGLYGFGAAAHIVMQVARWQGRAAYAFSRPGRTSPARSARSGPSARTSCRPSRWMRRSSTRRPASWCRRSLAVWSRKAPEARHPAS